MNINKTLTNGRTVGGDYFILIRNRRSDKYLNDYLPLFNFDDYHCLKTTNCQRLISYEEFIDFKYSGYTFFKKDTYDIEMIMEWVKWYNIFMKKSRGGGIQYLTKPTPPFSPNKIIIRK